MQPSSEQLAWEQTCSRGITSDLIWKLDVYRAALFLAHVARADCRTIRSSRQTDKLADQLGTAAASVSANLGEGYSRSTRGDRLRFLDYSLGSTRECISWYEAARDHLAADVVEQRMQLLARIRALLLGLIRSSRERRPGSQFEP